MEKKEKKIIKHACPVCGRFTTENALEKYSRMVADVKRGNEEFLRERNRLNDALDKAQEENNRIQLALSQHERTEGTLHKIIADQSKHICKLDSELRLAHNEIRLKQIEIEKLYARNLFERIMNIIPE